MKVIDIDSGIKYDIYLSKTAGEETILCPACSHLRKQGNKRKKCLSWNHSKGTGYCHNNGEKFSIPKDFSKKEYKRPEWSNNTKLSDNVVKWFEGRKIEQAELRRMKISEGIEWMPQIEKEINTIQFNYFRDDELINIKYRDGAKNFKLFKDAELVFYGLDDVKSKKTIIIVEGEMDKLSFGSVGYYNVLSVPNGASSGNNSNLEYIDNCINYFDEIEEIILATDEDLPGIQLRNELSSRLGIERCFKVSFKNCKDANEYLIEYGAEALRSVIQDKKPFPVEGVFSGNDFKDELKLLYYNGLQSGLKINIDNIDELITYEFGRLYTISGVPGHGKSEFLDFIIERLNVIHGLRVGYFSPENHPLQLHASKIIEKLTGNRFSQHSLPLEDYEESQSYFKDNFFFINPEDNFNVDNILNKARFLVKTKGIKVLVIDPYNKLDHQRQSNQTETEYISTFLDTLINFTKRNNIITFLVAHPRKMGKDVTGKHEVPTLYDINGSANFYNKTDFGITVYRDFKSNDSIIYIQKVKFKHLGKVGSCTFMWDKVCGRYTPVINGIAEPDIKNHLKTIIYHTEKAAQNIEHNRDLNYNPDEWTESNTEEAPF